MDNLETQETLATTLRTKSNQNEYKQNKNTTRKTKKIGNTNLTINQWWIHVLDKSKKFLFIIRLQPCYS
jgi:hypothetical protein